MRSLIFEISSCRGILNFTIHGDLNRCIRGRPLNAKSVPIWYLILSDDSHTQKLKLRERSRIVRTLEPRVFGPIRCLLREDKEGESADILVGEEKGRQQGARSLREPAGTDEGEQRAAVSVDTRVSIYELSGAVMSGVKIHRIESVCRVCARASHQTLL